MFVYVGLSISGVSSRGNVLHLNETMNRDLGKIYFISSHIF